MNLVTNQTSSRGELRVNEPMSRHTSWRAGGAARLLYEPADLDDLASFLQALPEKEPLLWLGLGSNLLVRDGGYPGTVIKLVNVISEIEREDSGQLRVGAGAPCAKVARKATQKNLSGAEFFAGIPGTMGGALAMNAGAFGGETWPLVTAVQTIDHGGTLHLRKPEEYSIGYRKCVGPDKEWFVTAWLSLQLSDDDTAGRIRSLLERRGATQPTGKASCGSVFTNPPDDHAARLIEACGLKGHAIGNAYVSTQHANFIINEGGASAADIESLIEFIQREVATRHGVELVPEVRIVGESQ